MWAPSGRRSRPETPPRDRGSELSPPVSQSTPRRVVHALIESRLQMAMTEQEVRGVEIFFAGLGWAWPPWDILLPADPRHDR